MRQESTKTSLFALFMGILLRDSLLGIPKVASIINPDKAIPAVLPESIDRIIEITKIFPDQVKKLEKPLLQKLVQQMPSVLIEKNNLKIR